MTGVTSPTDLRVALASTHRTVLAHNTAREKLQILRMMPLHFRRWGRPSPDLSQGERDQRMPSFYFPTGIRGCQIVEGLGTGGWGWGYTVIPWRVPLVLGIQKILDSRLRGSDIDFQARFAGRRYDRTQRVRPCRWFCDLLHLFVAISYSCHSYDSWFRLRNSALRSALRRHRTQRVRPCHSICLCKRMVSRALWLAPGSNPTGMVRSMMANSR
jgi:hypothetical protein